MSGVAICALYGGTLMMFRKPLEACPEFDVSAVRFALLAKISPSVPALLQALPAIAVVVGCSLLGVVGLFGSWPKHGPRRETGGVRRKRENRP